MTTDLPAPDPLILTAALDPDATGRFQALRDRHFPPALNIVPAHLTLFHKLPGNEARRIDGDLRAACATLDPIPFRTAGLRFLGRGVAIEVAADGLSALRGTLAALWRDWLTPQDLQGFRPHVTIQNKVAPAEARALRDAMLAGLEPLSGRVIGLDLWHYRGGPWERAGRYGFR